MEALLRCILRISVAFEEGSPLPALGQLDLSFAVVDRIDSNTMISTTRAQSEKVSYGQRSRQTTAHSQEILRDFRPPSTDQGALGQIAHITEHATIADHGIFRRLIGRVSCMWTNIVEDPFQDCGGECRGEIQARASSRSVSRRRMMSVDLSFGAVTLQL